VNDICVTRDQFAEVFGETQSAAAAGVPSSGVPPEAPAASPVPEGTDADAGTTTASNMAEPQPTIAPQDDSTATTESAEAENEEQLAPANDNEPPAELPATGTE
jgi:hypothetical protein